MRRILLSLSILGILSIPVASASAGPVEDVEWAYGQVKCIVTHPMYWYFECYGD
jgi:hypothetical protein